MPIVLLSDFGNADGYAGTMKGVISQMAPKLSVVDLSHEIPPFGIVQAALVLYQSYRYFPEGSIFVAVVDPGVGSQRKAILVKSPAYYFIAPDNGLLTLVLEKETPQKIIHLTNEAYFLNPASPTFQGRDIFAPVAAQLAEGIAPELFGQKILDYQRLPDFFPEVSKKKVQGKIISVDRFGNGVTNLSKEFLQKHFPGLKFFIQVRNKKIQTLKNHYAEVKGKSPFLLFGSSGFLEISMNQGSAAKQLRLKVGAKLQVKRA